jgi:hypothetical protein
MATIDERGRHEVYLAFEELLGAERADKVMSMLPPSGWADVARRDDVTREVSLLRADMGVLRADMGVLRADVRADMEVLRADVHADIEELRGEIGMLRSDMGSMEHRLDARLDRSIAQLTRTLSLGLIAALATHTAITLTAIQLTR